MRYIFGCLLVFNSLFALAQPACDSLFTLQKDKSPGRHTWVMHTPIALSNWSKDTATVELRLQKMRDRHGDWVILLTTVDLVDKCIKEGSKIYFKFTDGNEPGYVTQAAGNCEGVYQVEIPIQAVGTSMGSNKLKNLLRKKRLISVSLEHPKGFTDGILLDEQGEMLLDIINCMLEE